MKEKLKLDLNVSSTPNPLFFRFDINDHLPEVTKSLKAEAIEKDGTSRTVDFTVKPENNTTFYVLLNENENLTEPIVSYKFTIENEEFENESYSSSTSNMPSYPHFSKIFSSCFV